MCSTEMSTISKTNPNSNQSSKTNDGLNPVADLPPISTLTPPVTIYGVSPQLYIGQNGSSRTTLAYGSSIFSITTQDNSAFQLAAAYSQLNVPLKIYTGVNLSQIELGVSAGNRSIISHNNYFAEGYGLSLKTPNNSELIINNSKVTMNRDTDILKPVGFGESIIFNLQNDTANTPSERKAVFKYTEILPTIDDEGAQLEISVPGNTRVLPNTPGCSINLLQDKIQTTSKVAVYGTTPNLYIGQDDSTRSTISYSSAILQLSTQAGTFLQLQNAKISINENLEIYTGTTAEIYLGENNTNKVAFTYLNVSQKLQIDKEITILKTATTIDFKIQNNALVAATERYCNFEYFETGTAGLEGGALNISIPANTRRVPVTNGVSVLLQDDQIILQSQEVKFQNTLLNANSYLYLDTNRILTNTQPVPTSWTPVISFSTPSTSTVTYTSRYGLCWQYGNTSYVVFGIVGSINIATITNVLITGNLTYPSVTRITDIKFNNQSFIATTRFNFSSWSQVGQTTPAWLLGLYNLSALNGFTFNQYWAAGVGSNNVAFYGEGFLCHA